MPVEGVDQRAWKTRRDRWRHTIFWLVLSMITIVTLPYCTPDSDAEASDASDLATSP